MKCSNYLHFILTLDFPVHDCYTVYRIQTFLPDPEVISRPKMLKEPTAHAGTFLQLLEKFVQKLEKTNYGS